ncbi:MAG TPA: hypothetical protein DCO78_03085, partial [Chitinophagaceae bacterium]|nr:hypothetical protein [Chitinophagaceae bacterium]
HPKKWKEYFWEFFMLFLAVFCGFLAEIQVEHYVEHQREEKYMKSLVLELEQDVLVLKENSVELEANVRRLDTLIQIIGTGQENLRSDDLYYLARIGSRLGTLAINDFTILQLKYSGGFRLIRDIAVAKEISKHYNKLLTIERLYGINATEAEEYRKMALCIFDPLVFDSLVNPDNIISRPLIKPAFIDNNKLGMKKFAGMAAYIKNTRKSLIVYQNDFKQSAENLIVLINKAYNFK